MDEKFYLNIAKNMLDNSYAPYSKFKVGAVLLTEDEKYYTGCNIENSSYGNTICAERVALVKAISDGKKNFTKLYLTSISDKTILPCGICLQMLSEFVNQDFEIITADNKLECIKSYKFSQLMPNGFKLSEV